MCYMPLSIPKFVINVGAQLMLYKKDIEVLEIASEKFEVEGHSLWHAHGMHVTAL